MGGFLSYSIIGGMVMLAMYLVYRTLLAKENQPGFNRCILLVIYFAYFAAAPLLFALERTGMDSNPRPFSIETVDIQNLPVMITSRPMWGTVAIWIFMTGMTLVAMKTFATMIRLLRVILHGKRIKLESHTLVITDDNRYAPFSWMKYIVISREDIESNCSAITDHELRHVECRHWFDLLVAQTVCIINWFNPAAWLMRDELMLVHEYQADMAVIDNGHDASEYQMLLIKKAVGTRFPSLANSLNNSKLKKRITMMYKSKSGAGQKVKALALVPMLALALGLAEVPAVCAAVSTINSSDISVDKGSENLSKGKTSVKRIPMRIPDDEKNEEKNEEIKVIGVTAVRKAEVPEIKLSSESEKVTVNLDGKEMENVTVYLDGKEINKDEFKSLSSENIASIEVDKEGSAIRITSKTPEFQLNSIPEGLTIYLDGKKITEAELNGLDPKSIKSIDVFRNPDIIKIISK